MTREQRKELRFETWACQTYGESWRNDERECDLRDEYRGGCWWHPLVLPAPCAARAEETTLEAW